MLTAHGHAAARQTAAEALGLIGAAAAETADALSLSGEDADAAVAIAAKTAPAAIRQR